MALRLRIYPAWELLDDKVYTMIKAVEVAEFKHRGRLMFLVPYMGTQFLGLRTMNEDEFNARYLRKPNIKR